MAGGGAGASAPPILVRMKTLTAVAGTVLLAVAPMSASLVVSAEFREVVTEAALVVRGVVTDVRAVDARGRGVESMVTMAVESVVKGDSGVFVTLRVPGGELGRRRFVMVGAPRFAMGDRAVLFLKRDPEGWWRPIGLSQGVYRVRADGRSGLPVVPSPILSRVKAVPGRTAGADARRGTIPVQEFESLVRLVLERRVAVPREGGR